MPLLHVVCHSLSNTVYDLGRRDIENKKSPWVFIASVPRRWGHRQEQFCVFNSFTCDLGVDKVDNRVEMGRIENVEQLYYMTSRVAGRGVAPQRKTAEAFSDISLSPSLVYLFEVH